MHIDCTISATATLWAIQSGLESYVSKVAVFQHFPIGIIFTRTVPLVPTTAIAPNIDEIRIAFNGNCKFAWKTFSIRVIVVLIIEIIIFMDIRIALLRRTCICPTIKPSDAAKIMCIGVSIADSPIRTSGWRSCGCRCGCRSGCCSCCRSGFFVTTCWTWRIFSINMANLNMAF